MDTNTSIDTEKSVPVDAQDAPTAARELTGEERLLIYAVREDDLDEIARLLVRKAQRDGSSLSDVLQAAINTGDTDTLRAYSKAVADALNPVEPAWTYERRLALHLLGVMGLQYSGLDDALFTDHGSPGPLLVTIDAVADALFDGLHTLGCPRKLTLSQILDAASSFPTGEEE